MKNKRKYLLLIILTTLLSGCALGGSSTSSESSGMTYKDMKSMVIDILKTEAKIPKGSAKINVKPNIFNDIPNHPLRASSLFIILRATPAAKVRASGSISGAYLAIKPGSSSVKSPG